MNTRLFDTDLHLIDKRSNLVFDRVLSRWYGFTVDYKKIDFNEFDLP